ncbi:MAG TPA: amidohydrolase [Desulfobacterales bacterium]|nr:amidohydrolase [Desulfobacterales bacterium]HIP38149.1 amidohydrolase [Desulfocapsa sulfexigens]
MKDIKTIIAGEESNITAIRQKLHKIPERGFAEKKTAQFIDEHLRGILGIEVSSGIAQTGIVGLLKSGKPGKTLLIRADMDGLPIHEETGLSFASTHDNMMHACGHDGHMAIALVTASVLAGMKDCFSGNIKFMFQPAEEGPGGAKPMIEAGVLENPQVDYAVACHLWPGLPAGSFGVKPGVLMAAGSSFTIEISGKGGHGAMPHLCVDALDTAVQVANSLQRVVNQKIDPLSPSVITIASLHGGTAPNVIAEKASLTGMIRIFDKSTWQDYPKLFNQIISGICDSMGASYTFEHSQGYPPLENDPGMVEIMKKCMGKVVAHDRIIEPESTMGAEDMAFILERVKGCYFFIGTGFDGCAPLHNAEFRYDDSVLLSGVESFVRFALDLLK